MKLSAPTFVLAALVLPACGALPISVYARTAVGPAPPPAPAAAAFASPVSPDTPSPRAAARRTVLTRAELERIERPRVLAAARKYVREAPVTVTAYRATRSAGGPHDYFSEGDYWWPDPKNLAGPYIQRDGETNPGNFDLHRRALRRFSLIVPALVAAYELTGDRRYERGAVAHLRAWFADTATRMTPNLLYAQAIHGRATGRGIGIIDGLHLVEVARATGELERLGVLRGADRTAVDGWFRAYLEWITTHPFGAAERDNGNNHSTAWAVQVAQLATLLDDTIRLAETRRFFRETLLPGQLASDGSFPKELARTKPYSYSLFNLDLFAELAWILSTPDDDLWAYTTADGRGLRKAIAFMVPYIADRARWPRPPDVQYFEVWPMRQVALLFGGIAYHDSAWVALWKRLPADSEVEEVVRNFPIRQPLLWVTDEAEAGAGAEAEITSAAPTSASAPTPQPQPQPQDGLSVHATILPPVTASTSPVM